MLHNDQLFAYGTLTFNEVMFHLIGREVSSKGAIIKGYSAYMIKGKNFPGLRINTKASRTEGILYSGLEEADWEILDQFEDSFYQREVLSVNLNDGSKEDAYTYLIHSENYSILSKHQWNSNYFEENFLDSYLNMILGFNKN